MACTADTDSIDLSVIGSTLSADLRLDPDPSNVAQITTDGLLVSSSDVGLPTGLIVPFGGPAVPPPTGWLKCDGSAISRSVYSALFSVISTRYGAGDGSTTFNLPGAWTGDREWDEALLTAGVTGISATSEGTAQTVIPGNAVVYDGTPVRIEFFIPAVVASGGAPNPTFVLMRDAAVVTTFVGGNTGISGGWPVEGEVPDTPAAGSHTYSLKAFVDSGSFSAIGGAGNGSGTRAPGVLRVIGSHTRIIKA